MNKRLPALLVSVCMVLSAAAPIVRAADKQPVKIECELYSEWSKGTQDFTDTNDIRIVETNGCKQIEGTSNGAWLKYEGVDFSDGKDTVSVRQSSNSFRCCKDARLEIRLGSLTGEVAAKVPLPATSTVSGDWSKYSTEKVKLEKIVEGVQDVYLVLLGTDDLTTNPTKTVIANLDYCTFTFEAKYRDPVTQSAADRINALPDEEEISAADGEALNQARQSFLQLSKTEQDKMTDESARLQKLTDKYLSLNEFTLTYINVPKSTAFKGAQYITLLAPVEYGMYYTTDGSDPSPENSAAVKKAEKNAEVKILLDKTTTVKAAVDTPIGIGNVKTETYTFVPYIPATGFSLKAPEYVKVGKTGAVKVENIAPQNASDKKAAFKSLNFCAAVSQSGEIKGLKAGLAKIEVTVGSVKKTALVKIKSTAAAIKPKQPAVKVKRGKATGKLTKYFSVKSPAKAYLLKTKYTFKATAGYVKIKSSTAVIAKNAKKGKTTVRVLSGKKTLGRIVLKIV